MVGFGDERRGELDSLRGREIPSELAQVVYRVDRAIGEGGMSVTFFALRLAPSGETPVVLKIVRPEVARGAGVRAALMVRKEAVALGRLNEQVPPTPYVVRLLDAGGVKVGDTDLPWLAVEYVHGGAEGTTLFDRVEHSVQRTGFAFDAERAAHAVDCIARGLCAAHEVGVVHRDVTPSNVLCSGFGQSEVFKIADFGIARPVGMSATFGGLAIGTPGYAPPEQAMLDPARVGPWSDVFSFAAVVYFLLAGRHYFDVTALGALEAARSSARQRLADSDALCPELRARPAACAVVDAALARATAPDAKERPPSPDVLARMLLPALRAESRRMSAVPRRLESVGWDDTTVLGWTWRIRHRPGDGRVVRSAAWDGVGRCLAATTDGLAFWDGTSFRQVSASEPAPGSIRCVRTVSPGTWLLAGEGARLAVLDTEGVGHEVSGSDPAICFAAASGDLADLVALVAEAEGTAPALYAMASGRWVKPVPLKDASAVAALERLTDTSWLVAGRDTSGESMLMVYEPLMFEARRMMAPRHRAYLAAGASVEAGHAMVVGTGGRTVRLAQGEVERTSVVPGEPDLAAVGVDATGRAWAGGAGALYLQQGAKSLWTRVWTNPAWTAPFVSVHADVGRVVAMTADGGILEGAMSAT